MLKSCNLKFQFTNKYISYEKSFTLRLPVCGRELVFHCSSSCTKRSFCLRHHRPDQRGHGLECLTQTGPANRSIQRGAAQRHRRKNKILRCRFQKRTGPATRSEMGHAASAAVFHRRGGGGVRQGTQPPLLHTDVCRPAAVHRPENNAGLRC